MLCFLCSIFIFRLFKAIILGHTLTRDTQFYSFHLSHLLSPVCLISVFKLRKQLERFPGDFYIIPNTVLGGGFYGLS